MRAEFGIARRRERCLLARLLVLRNILRRLGFFAGCGTACGVGLLQIGARFGSLRAGMAEQREADDVVAGRELDAAHAQWSRDP